MTQESYKTCSTAPGKIVLWGEYAVLEGAPAVTMAVSRYSKVDLATTQGSWEFISKGFNTPGLHLFEKDFCYIPATQFAELTLKHLGFNDFHVPFSLSSDTSSFYRKQKKVGLGSSASLATATYHALTQLLGVEASLEGALEIHKRWQSGSGSGIDVATSWFGGTIKCARYPNLTVSPFRLPDSLFWQIIWTGRQADTREHLKKFDASINRKKVRLGLDQLCAASEELTKGTISLESIRSYKEILENFDQLADLKIFTTEHQRLDRIAAELGLVYKPCGAGGGDIGIAFAKDHQSLTAFNQQIKNTEFMALDMEIAVDGVKTN
ncbi:hypothetical protein OAL14_01715 [Gammaproteobacteria bacterium]|nr:hypothetical protein [Gammaproteobacteria bacterium]